MNHDDRAVSRALDTQGQAAALDDAIIDRAVAALLARHDELQGGFGHRFADPEDGGLFMGEASAVSGRVQRTPSAYPSLLMALNRLRRGETSVSASGSCSRSVSRVPSTSS